MFVTLTPALVFGRVPSHRCARTSALPFDKDAIDRRFDKESTRPPRPKSIARVALSEIRTRPFSARIFARACVLGRKGLMIRAVTTNTLTHCPYSHNSRALHAFHRQAPSATAQSLKSRADTMGGTAPITIESPPDQMVSLNVGGARFETTLGTLREYPESMLAGMFSGRHRLARDSSGAVFVNRNPALFCVILDYLRQGRSISCA